MKNAMNKVLISGYAGADVQLKEFGKSQKLAKVNVAVNEYSKNKAGEELKKTNWFMLTFWNEQAEKAAQEIKKGSLVSIEGRLQTGSYDAKDGSKRYTTEIIVQNLMVEDNTLQEA